MSNPQRAKLLPQLSGNYGKFALMRGDDLVAIYDWFDDALQAAHSLCEGERFSIEKITPAPRAATAPTRPLQ